MKKNLKSTLTLSALQVKNINSPNELKGELFKTRFFNTCFDKNRIKLLVSWSLKNCGQKITIDLIENLKNLGFRYATQAGISLGVDDLRIPSTKNILISTAEKNIKKTSINSKQEYLTGIEKFQHLIDTWHKTSEVLKQDVISNFQLTDVFNPVYMMAFSGARGNVSQVRQLVGMRGLMSDPQGQILNFPIKSNFREGITLTEYIISCYGARKGLVDTALKTANSGYLTRRLVDVSHHIIVCDLDCKTKRGVFISNILENRKIIVPLQNRLIGRVLAEDIYPDPSSGISKNNLPWALTSSKASNSNNLSNKIPEIAFGPSQASLAKLWKNPFWFLGPEKNKSKRPGGLSEASLVSSEARFKPSKAGDRTSLASRKLALTKQGKLMLFFYFVAKYNSAHQVIIKNNVWATSIPLNTLGSFGPKSGGPENNSIFAAQQFIRRSIDSQNKETTVSLKSFYPKVGGLKNLGPKNPSEETRLWATWAPGGHRPSKATFLGSSEASFSGFFYRSGQFFSRRTPWKLTFLIFIEAEWEKKGRLFLAKQPFRGVKNQKQFILFLDIILLYKLKFIAKKNQEISVGLAKKIAALKKSVFVRSPLTCEIKNSICQLCYGWSLAHGKLVSLGEAVGVVAAQSIGEPGTQLTMRTFHTGGVFSGDIMNEIVAPFPGKIIFDDFLPGMLIRTPHGKIAFLTKAQGNFKLEMCAYPFSNSKSSTKKKMSSFCSFSQDRYYDTKKLTVSPKFFSPVSGTLKNSIKQGLGPAGAQVAHKKVSSLGPKRNQINHKRVSSLGFFGPKFFKPPTLGPKNFTEKLENPPFKRKNTIFQIPAFSVLFVRNQESVTKGQSLAEFSLITTDTNQRIQASHDLRAESEGEILFKSLLLLTRKNRKTNKIISRTTYKLGCIWILSGKICLQSIPINLFSQPGDLVDKNSIVAQYETMSSYSGFVSTHKVPTGKTANFVGHLTQPYNPPYYSVLLKKNKNRLQLNEKSTSKKWLEYPLLSYSVKSFQYKRIGYFFSLFVKKNSGPKRLGLESRVFLPEVRRTFYSKVEGLKNLGSKNPKPSGLGFSFNEQDKTKDLQLNSHKCFLSNSRNHEFKNSRYLNKNFFLKVFPPQYQTETGGQLIYDNFYLKKKEGSQKLQTGFAGEIFWVPEETHFIPFSYLGSKVRRTQVLRTFYPKVRRPCRPIFNSSKNFINYFTKTSKDTPFSATQSKKTQFLSLQKFAASAVKKVCFAKQGSENTTARFVSEVHSFCEQNRLIKQSTSLRLKPNLKKHIQRFSDSFKQSTKKFTAKNRSISFYYNSQGKFSVFSSKLFGYTQSFVISTIALNKNKKKLHKKSHYEFNEALDLFSKPASPEKQTEKTPCDKIKLSVSANALDKRNKNFQNSKIYSFHYKFQQICFNLNPLSKFFNPWQNPSEATLGHLWVKPSEEVPQTWVRRTLGLAKTRSYGPLWLICWKNKNNFSYRFGPSEESPRGLAKRETNISSLETKSAKQKQSFFLKGGKKTKFFFSPNFTKQNKKFFTKNVCLEKSLQFYTVKKGGKTAISLLTKHRLTVLQPHFPWKVFIHKHKKLKASFKSYFFFNEKEKKILSQLYFNSFTNKKNFLRPVKNVFARNKLFAEAAHPLRRSFFLGSFYPKSGKPDSVSVKTKKMSSFCESTLGVVSSFRRKQVRKTFGTKVGKPFPVSEASLAKKVQKGPAKQKIGLALAKQGLGLLCLPKSCFARPCKALEKPFRFLLPFRHSSQKMQLEKSFRFFLPLRHFCELDLPRSASKKLISLTKGKTNYKHIENKFNYFKILEIQQAPNKQTKKAKSQAVNYIKIKIKPGWIYFPTYKQTENFQAQFLRRKSCKSSQFLQKPKAEKTRAEKNKNSFSKASFGLKKNFIFFKTIKSTEPKRNRKSLGSFGPKSVGQKNRSCFLNNRKTYFANLAKQDLFRSGPKEIKGGKTLGPKGLGLVPSGLGFFGPKSSEARQRFAEVNGETYFARPTNLAVYGPKDLGPTDPRLTGSRCLKNRRFFLPLQRTFAAEIFKKHKKVIKPGAICFDTILFDQYPVYCQCVSMSKISIQNNKYLLKKNISLQKQIQFTNLLKEFEYYKNEISSDNSSNELQRVRIANFSHFEVYTLKKCFFNLFYLKLRYSLLFKNHFDISQLYQIKKTYKNIFYLVIKRVLGKTITTEVYFSYLFGHAKIYFLKNKNFTTEKYFIKTKISGEPKFYAKPWNCLKENQVAVNGHEESCFARPLCGPKGPTKKSTGRSGAAKQKRSFFLRVASLGSQGPQNNKKAALVNQKIFMVISKVKFYSFQTVTQYKKLLAQQNRVSTSEASSLIFSRQKVRTMKKRKTTNTLHLKKGNFFPSEAGLAKQGLAKPKNLQFGTNSKKNRNGFYNPEAAYFAHEIARSAKTLGPTGKPTGKSSTVNFTVHSVVKLPSINKQNITHLFCHYPSPDFYLKFFFKLPFSLGPQEAQVAPKGVSSLGFFYPKVEGAAHLGPKDPRPRKVGKITEGGFSYPFEPFVFETKEFNGPTKNVFYKKTNILQYNIIFIIPKNYKSTTTKICFVSKTKQRTFGMKNNKIQFDAQKKKTYSNPFTNLNVSMFIELQNSNLTSKRLLNNQLTRTKIFSFLQNYISSETSLRYTNLLAQYSGEILYSGLYRDTVSSTQKLPTRFAEPQTLAKQDLGFLGLKKAKQSSLKKNVVFFKPSPSEAISLGFLVGLVSIEAKSKKKPKGVKSLFARPFGFSVRPSEASFVGLAKQPSYGRLICWKNKNGFFYFFGFSEARQKFTQAAHPAHEINRGNSNTNEKNRNLAFLRNKSEKQNYLTLTSDEQVTFAINTSNSWSSPLGPKDPSLAKQAQRGLAKQKLTLKKKRSFCFVAHKRPLVRKIRKTEKNKLFGLKVFLTFAGPFGPQRGLVSNEARLASLGRTGKLKILQPCFQAPKGPGLKDLRGLGPEKNQSEKKTEFFSVFCGLAKVRKNREPYTLGYPMSYGAKLSKNLVIPTAGVAIQIEKLKITVRKAQPLSFSAKGLVSVYQGDIIEKNTLIIRLFYQRLKTGDIVQGIPRIEQLFEARKTNQGALLSGSLHEQLETIFLYYIDTYNFSTAARYSLEKIQQIIVSSVQKVYRSQGVTIADKHLEIIIRQMTSKVEVIESGHTSLLPGEIVDLDWIEVVNKDIHEENTKAKYVPIILGITRKSLETQSFLSEASFQETTRVLTKSSIERRTDFLKGLKENVILGHLVPAGTGFYSNTAFNNNKKMFLSIKNNYSEMEISESYTIFRRVFSPLLFNLKMVVNEKDATKSNKKT
uniref:DNA-directed RNA polymerase subunit beta'' n=1 Tax=Prasiolopsis wulf-kochii TaxID=3239232 RepID=A0A097KJZ0_9CHLO|nr:beta'' subunit of RNA polymerase [Prasiolopsis sp. SAG 84.81]